MYLVLYCPLWVLVYAPFMNFYTSSTYGKKYTITNGYGNQSQILNTSWFFLWKIRKIFFRRCSNISKSSPRFCIFIYYLASHLKFLKRNYNQSTYIPRFVRWDREFKNFFSCCINLLLWNGLLKVFPQIIKNIFINYFEVLVNI